jgi:hypothetical protein
MSLFKKAMVATAIVAACSSVHAGEVSDATVSHSVQGLGATAGSPSDSSVRVIAGESLRAGDLITLTFGAGVVDLSGSDVDGGTNASVVDDIVVITYGTGSYTTTEKSFTPAVTNASGAVTTGAILVLEITTGSSIPADSSLEVQIPGVNILAKSAAEATVTYSASRGGVAIDTTGDNVGNLVVTEDQYSASVKTAFNGVIEREEQKTFVSGGVAGANGTEKDADTLVITVKDDQDLLSAAKGVLVKSTVSITATSNWPAPYAAAGTSPTTPEVKGPTYAVTNPNGDTLTGPVISTTNPKVLTFTVVDEATTDGIADDYTLTIDYDQKSTISANSYSVAVSVDADSGLATNTPQVLLDGAAAGEWRLDATEINVPYLPVGFDDTTASIHFSNTATTDVPVSMSAVSLEADKSNKKYASVDLDDLEASSVTKLSQTKIMELFDITEKTKLSITFNIGGDADKVQAYATISSPEGRAEVSNSLGNGIE